MHQSFELKKYSTLCTFGFNMLTFQGQQTYGTYDPDVSSSHMLDGSFKDQKISASRHLKPETTISDVFFLRSEGCVLLKQAYRCRFIVNIIMSQFSPFCTHPQTLIESFFLAGHKDGCINLLSGFNVQISSAPSE